MMRKKTASAILLLLILAGCRAETQPLTLALMGDVMLGRGIAQAYPHGDLDAAFAAAQPYLQAADLALANLESPIGAPPFREGSGVGDPSHGYNLCAAPTALPALRDAGFDVLTLANNHQGDCVPNGAAQTAELLRAAGLTPIPPTTGVSPVLLPCGEWLCAILTLDDVSTPLDLDTASEAITAATGQADIVIVSVHWGAEYAPAATTRQRYLAQAFADAGAHLVWGHHPHVLQPVAWVQGAGQPYPTLVAYSLGNTLFDQSPPDARRTALLRVEMSPAGVQSVRAVPLVLTLPGWQLSLAEGDDAGRILERLDLK